MIPSHKNYEKYVLLLALSYRTLKLTCYFGTKNEALQKNNLDIFFLSADIC